MYTRLHGELVKAADPVLRYEARASVRPGRGMPPPRPRPGRVRASAAYALASAARRLDRERARRVVA